MQEPAARQRPYAAARAHLLEPQVVLDLLLAVVMPQRALAVGAQHVPAHTRARTTKAAPAPSSPRGNGQECLRHLPALLRTRAECRGRGCPACLCMRAR